MCPALLASFVRAVGGRARLLIILWFGITPQLTFSVCILLIIDVGIERTIIQSCVVPVVHDIVRLWNAYICKLDNELCGTMTEGLYVDYPIQICRHAHNMILLKNWSILRMKRLPSREILPRGLWRFQINTNNLIIQRKFSCYSGSLSIIPPTLKSPMKFRLQVL